MVAGGRRPASRKLWHLYLWSSGRILRVLDHQAPRAIKSPSSWFFSARATKRAVALYTITIDVTPKTTEQNRIVCTSKSEAEVTNKKNLRSRYGTIDATKLTTDRHEASRGLFATAELLVIQTYDKWREMYVSFTVIVNVFQITFEFHYKSQQNFGKYQYHELHRADEHIVSRT